MFTLPNLFPMTTQTKKAYPRFRVYFPERSKLTPSSVENVQPELISTRKKQGLLQAQRYGSCTPTATACCDIQANQQVPVCPGRGQKHQNSPRVKCDANQVSLSPSCSPHLPSRATNCCFQPFVRCREEK